MSWTMHWVDNVVGGGLSRVGWFFSVIYRKKKEAQHKINAHQFQCQIARVGRIEHGQHASEHPHCLGLDLFGGPVRHRWILMEQYADKNLSTGWECKKKESRVNRYLGSSIISTGCLRGRPPELHIKLTRRIRPRHL